MDLYDFMDHASLGSPGADPRGRTGSSSWGWIDHESGRVFVAAGLYNGTSLIEILPTGRMQKLDFL